MTQIDHTTETLQKLKQLLNPPNNTYQFLGFTLNLKTATLTNHIGQVNPEELSIKLLPAMLSHYTQAKPAPSIGNLVKFKDLPGGYSYADTFTKRAVEPVAKTFGDDPELMGKASQLLGGKPLGLGEASFVVEAFKGIPLTYILWSSDEEFAAEVSILFDDSASSYLPTEDLAVLGELTTVRLIAASKTLSN
ncbi:MAG: DUF3786 domain-containing protein [Candidatus Bathyarchaeia archaeon]|jgi:hypothetical protein